MVFAFSPMKQHPKFNKQYFIAKFEAIPENDWCTGNIENVDGQRCAIGHCVQSDGDSLNEEEIDALKWLFISNGHKIDLVNDRIDQDYKQATPKQRVLAALRDIK